MIGHCQTLPGLPRAARPSGRFAEGKTPRGAYETFWSQRETNWTRARRAHLREANERTTGWIIRLFAKGASKMLSCCARRAMGAGNWTAHSAFCDDKYQSCLIFQQSITATLIPNHRITPMLRPCYGPLFLSRAKRAPPKEKGDRRKKGTITWAHPHARKPNSASGLIVQNL